MFDNLGENLKAVVRANSHGTIMVFAGHKLGFGSLQDTGEVLKAWIWFCPDALCVELKGAELSFSVPLAVSEIAPAGQSAGLGDLQALWFKGLLCGRQLLSLLFWLGTTTSCGGVGTTPCLAAMWVCVCGARLWPQCS
ncbi:hypothetical protein GJAV_G00232230 [Gymnothorax javanicus]|nr:hypothetical protein GJAV_G00232230 [Gymnothorax javanicus]